MSPEQKIKLQKTLKGAAIAGGGVFVTYLLQAIGQMDFGAYSPMIAGIASVVINAVRELLKSYAQ